MATLAIGETRREIWLRAGRDGLWLAGSLVGAACLIVAILAPGFDAHAYWNVDPADPYSRGLVGDGDAFLYSPTIAIVALPLHLLPFPVMRFGLMAVELACLWWMTGRWALAFVALPPVSDDLLYGNIHLLLAAAIVLAVRYPAAWSFLLLTKVTPGIGVLWYAVRREWRSLGGALGVTAALAAISLLIVPGWWALWEATLTQSAVTPSGFSLSAWTPLWLRLPAAAGIVAWGALTDRRWTLPLAAVAAAPALWMMSFAMLVGVVPLLQTNRRTTAADAV